jgi:purine nucleoside phosphorylase
MKIAGLSLVSNMAAGISMRKLDHAEVVSAGDAAKPAMRALLDNFISRI